MVFSPLNMVSMALVYTAIPPVVPPGTLSAQKKAV